MRERDAAQDKAAKLAKELEESTAAAVESDNRRLVAEAHMKDYRTLRERLEEAAAAAAAARGRTDSAPAQTADAAKGAAGGGGGGGGRDSEDGRGQCLCNCPRS